jgi:hypothetical protein
MIRSLEENFLASQKETDENSRAYVAVMNGEVPLTSVNTHTHIASRLLTIRFLDIFHALDKEIEMDVDVVEKKAGNSLHKTIVCFFFTSFRHYDSCSQSGSFRLDKTNIKGP